MSYFEVKNLSAGYDKELILKNISFDVAQECLLGVLGANGCGKTTLLKAICGLLPHTGSCLLQGSALEQMSARKIAGLCSYIPQRSGISIDISALDVVLMGFNPVLKLLEKPNRAMIQRAVEALAIVGLSGKEHENYLHFSEGQKQLCILARTLVTDSRLFLLDEPESSLDFHYRYQMLEILQNWIHEKKISVMTSLHDPALALNFCDKLLVLSQGTVLGILDPKCDSIEHIEELLSEIYGPVSLQRCTTKDGHSHLAIFKENSL